MTNKTAIKTVLYEKAHAAILVQQSMLAESLIVEKKQGPKLIKSPTQLVATSTAEFLAYFKTQNVKPSDVKDMIKNLTPRIEKAEDNVYALPQTSPKLKVKKAILAALSNKMKAAQQYLSWLEDRDNETVEKENSRKEKIRSGVESIVDKLSGGNPLIQSVVSTLANKILKDKERVSYKSDDDED